MLNHTELKCSVASDKIGSGVSSDLFELGSELANTIQTMCMSQCVICLIGLY